MLKSKADIYVILGIFVFVISLMIFGCSTDDTISATEMYQKCATVNEENPELCDQTFTVYQ